LLACSDSGREGVAARITSPAGWAEGQIVEHEFDNTQVRVVFDGGSCTAGSVSSHGVRLGLRLRWIDDTTLEVAYPPGVMLDRPPSGPIAKCGDREVRVVLAKQ
jgi:hypothetical protein